MDNVQKHNTCDKNWFHPKQQQKLLKHFEQYFGIILKN
jgi:hypothetical protein